MNLVKFNQINESIKTCISELQLSSHFNQEEFTKLHKELLKIINKDNFYEDIRRRLIDMHNSITSRDLSCLTDIEGSYHTLLMVLHKKIIMDIDKKDSFKINISQLPKDIKEFHKILKSTKKFYKEDRTYYIISEIGCAKGHLITIKVSDEIRIEYNDNSPSRTMILRERLIDKRWDCSKINVIKNIIPRKPNVKSYFFMAKKERIDEDLKNLAIELTLGIDTDFSLLDENSNYSEKEIETEFSLLKTAFLLYDEFGLFPVIFINIAKNLLLANQ